MHGNNLPYGTRAEEVIDLKKQMQGDFNEQIGDCVVNIIV